jgi:hypothetical protein
MIICSKRAFVAALITALIAVAGQAGRTQDMQVPVGDSALKLPPGVHDVTVLFAGKATDLAQNWVDGGRTGQATGKPARWKVRDGAMTASGSYICTREKYTDFQLHLEFRVPNMPNAKGQGKGNSGVFLQGRYELQILDSYGIETPGTGDCGAIYRVAAPLVNACKPPETWQTYDISFRAPRFDDMTHEMQEPARVTVWLNGVAVQNETEVAHNTHTLQKKKGQDGKMVEIPLPPDDLNTPGPIALQYHGNAVAFRNIWIRPLKDRGNPKYE